MVEIAVEKVSITARNGASNGWLLEDGIATANYQMEEPIAVSQFLHRHPFLASLLAEAWPKVNEVFGVFGKDTRVKLALFDDPEFLGNPKLYAMILTPLAVEAVLPLQSRFDQTWWLDNLERAQGKLNFDVEYV